MQTNIRKTQLSVEEIWHEGGSPVTAPIKVATALAVIENPFSGRYEPDLMEFQSSLRELGRSLSARLVEAVGANAVQAYGKGAIVGEDGELEHGAVWHEAGGWALRERSAEHTSELQSLLRS